MKTILSQLLFLCAVLASAQEVKKDTLLFSLKQDYENSERIMSKYEQLRFAKDVFIYKEKGKAYSYYERPIYDSLVKANIIDSITLAKSILKIKKNELEYFVFQNEFHLGNNILVTYVNNRLTFIETFNYKDRAYSKKDIINKIWYSYYDGEDKKISHYSISKYKYVKSNNDFYDIKYVKTVYQDGKIIEHNYEKDFTIPEEQILKKLPEFFLQQAPQLMKGQKYRRDYGDKNFEREFDSKEAKQESELLKSLLDKKQVNIDKIYNDENHTSFYRVDFYIDWRIWVVEINPRTGNIIRITFGLLKD